MVNHDNEDDVTPTKIIDMGLVPGTEFMILFQSPFNGLFYVGFGKKDGIIAA